MFQPKEVFIGLRYTRAKRKKSFRIIYCFHLDRWRRDRGIRPDRGAFCDERFW